MVLNLKMLMHKIKFVQKEILSNFAFNRDIDTMHRLATRGDYPKLAPPSLL